MKKQSIDWVKDDTIEIKYGNGLVFTGDCLDLPEDIYQPCAAARHGIAQKLGDAKSGGTAAEKHAEVVEIWASLLGNAWNRRATGAGVEALIERAYAILAGKAGQPEAQAEVWYEQYLEMDEAKREMVRAKPFMKAAIEAARAERKLGGTTTEEFNPNA